MTNGHDLAEEAAGQAFEITRVFDAPRELVFKVWTEAEHLAQWWGPAGMALRIERLDFQPGGTFHYRMRSPDDHHLWGKFEYREIQPPERIVFLSSFADAEGNTIRAPFSDDWPLEIHSTVTFSDLGGKTRLEMSAVPVESTDAEQAMFESFFESMEQGYAGTFAQLDEHLKAVQA